MVTNEDTLSEIRGVPVITRDQGVNLGSVAYIYLDPKSRKLAAVSFKNRKTNEDVYVETDGITLVGQDVVLIKGGQVVKPLKSQEELGRRLRKLRGMIVTTASGKNLGKLDDFDLDHQTRMLSQLHLDEGRMLPVDPLQVTIGPDAIIVPTEYVDRVQKAPEKKGFVERVRGWADRGHAPQREGTQHHS